MTALLLMLGMCINPVVSSNDAPFVYALDGSDGDIVPENGVALRIDTALNDANTVEEQVSGNGTQYIKVDFTVGANNIQNYDVYVQADSTALTGASHGEKLQSITSNTTGTVGNKEWGYAVERGDVEPNTMTYKPIQTSVSTSADGQDAGSGNTLTGISQPYTLAFAANLDGMAADHYKSNITLSVAAGATDTVKTGLGFNGITEMQQMTSSICSSAANGLEGRLKDTRDQKVYWVAKFKNMCWMTQNLDLDLKTTEPLTGEKSDVTANWTPGYDTGTTSTTIKEWGENYSTQKSYDPGNYYYTTPGTTNTCATNNIGLSACTENGWKINVASNADISGIVDVTGWTTTYDTYFINATSYIGTDEQSICTKTAGSILGNSAYAQCRIYYDGYTYNYSDMYEHYHAGNYYSWGAANAGTTDASSSICPKGWRLPTGGDKVGEQYNLFNGMNGTTLAFSPYYFTYNGMTNGLAIQGIGTEGTYWSSTSNGSASYRAGISNYSVNTSYVSKYCGMSVRCVAR